MASAEYRYVYLADDELHGPYQLAEMRHWYHEDVLPAGVKARRHDSNVFYDITEFPEIVTMEAKDTALLKQILSLLENVELFEAVSSDKVCFDPLHAAARGMTRRLARPPCFSCQHSACRCCCNSTGSMLPLAWPQRERMAEKMSVVDYSDNDVIFEQDSVGDAFYVIERGNVSVVSTKGAHTKRPDGEPVELVVLGSGKCFGERALIQDEGRSAACIAKGEARCLRLTRVQFMKILGPMVEILFPSLRTSSPPSSPRASSKPEEHEISYSFYGEDGEYHGPYSLETMRAWFSYHQLTADTMTRRSDLADFIRLGDYSEMYGELPTTSSSATTSSGTAQVLSFMSSAHHN